MREEGYETTPARSLAYARLTEDFNPLHLDAAFAAGTPYGRPIAHGTQALARAWPAIEAAAGPGGLAGQRVSVRFRAPVFVGERVEARAGPAGADGAPTVEVRAGEEERVAILVTLAPAPEGDDAGG